MAITKTVQLKRVVVYEAKNSSAADDHNDKWPSLLIEKTNIIDDPDDNELPVYQDQIKHLYKFDDEGNEVSYIDEAQLVQDICNALWAAE